MAVNIKRYMQTLAIEKENFRTVFELSPAAMTIRAGSRYVDVNQAWLALTKFTKSEVVGKTASELNIVDNYLELRHKNDIAQQDSGAAEIQFRTKQGEEKTGLWTYSIIQYNNAPHVLTSLIDITEKKQVEQELARAENYNFIGEMAVGISHEIRNPMTTVRGYLQLLQRKEKFNEYAEIFSIMLDEIDRANAIITRFLTLAKNKRFDFRLCDLNSAIFAIKPLLKTKALQRGCVLELETGELPLVSADEESIGQLVLNLAMNGIEAMEPGGQLTIKTYTDAGKLILEVKDTGPGIAEDLLDKIWTPFFSTKENGAGLGLPLCYKIAKQHGASIYLDTSPNGTRATVKFKL